MEILIVTKVTEVPQGVILTLGAKGFLWVNKGGKDPNNPKGDPAKPAGRL